MKNKTLIFLGVSSLTLAFSVLITACGSSNASSVPLKGNASRAPIGTGVLKRFAGYKTDDKLADAVLGASAETAPATVANGANVSVKLVLRGANGELVALHGTAAGVRPDETRLLALDAGCSNSKYELEISCRMEYCGTLGVRLIEKADASLPSFVETKIGPNRPDGQQYRQVGIVFRREGVTEELVEKRKANRRAMKEAAKNGQPESVMIDPALKVTPGPMKRARTDRASGSASAETSFEAAVETLRKGKENISLINACVDQAGGDAATEEAAPSASKPEVVTDVQPVDDGAKN